MTTAVRRRMTDIRKPRNSDLLRLAMWERLVNDGADWMDAWDQVLRDPGIGRKDLQGTSLRSSDKVLHTTWRRAMERHCPEVLARITEQAQLQLAGSAGPAVRTIVQMADPDRAVTHRDYANGEKNKLDAAKFVLGSLGVGPDVRGGGATAVQVNVHGGAAEVRPVQLDPDLHDRMLALDEEQARRRREASRGGA